MLCDYLHLLESWKVQYAPKTPEDVLDDRFVEACQMLDYVAVSYTHLDVYKRQVMVRAIIVRSPDTFHVDSMPFFTKSSWSKG